jgi:hypothetical protein
MPRSASLESREGVDIVCLMKVGPAFCHAHLRNLHSCTESHSESELDNMTQKACHS